MYRSAEYIFKGKVQNIFDSFSNLLGIRISFSSFEKTDQYDFKEYHIGYNRPKCQYCSFLQQKLGLLNECIYSDKIHIKEATDTRELVAYNCHGGMTEAIMPINLIDNVIGFIMIGEIRNSKKPPANILKLCTDDTQRKELIETYQKTKYYTSKEIDSIMEIFSTLVSHIIQSKLITDKHCDSITPLINFMEENPQTNLSLPEAAELLFCSVSSLTQNFKKATGKTFKQFQIELKLNKADELFESDQDLAISQVAKKLGFNDPLYFSRIYKKHRGHSPSQKRK